MTALLSFALGILTGQTLPGGDVSAEYRLIPRLAEAAERIGFESIWLSQHHGAEDGWLPALLPMLAAAASVTDRLGLGTEDLNPTFGHPIRLAEDAAVLDQMSRGRLLLGLGLGWRREEFARFGIDAAEQPARVAEIIGILRQYWAGDGTPHAGRFYHLPGGMVHPGPFQPGGPPILLSISRPVQRRWAAALADEVMFSRSGPGAAQTRPGPSDIAAAHDEVRAARGTALPLTVLLNAVLADGDPWQVIGPGHDHQFRTYARWQRSASGLPPDAAAEATMIAAGRALMLCGRPAELIAALLPFVTTLTQRAPLRLMLKLHYPGVDPAVTVTAMRRFADEVAPALCEAAIACSQR